MAAITDNDALRQYYNQVIDTHKSLAAALSAVAGTVVDGRIPGHDLLKMLRDLAAREVIMADNWTLIRDGLLSGNVNADVPRATDTIPEAEEAGLHAALLKSYDATSVDKEDPQVRSEMVVEDNTQHTALPQTGQEAGFLTVRERKRLTEELQKAQKAHRAAKSSKKVGEQLKLNKYIKEIVGRLQENNRLRRLGAQKDQQVGLNTEEAITAKQTEILTMLTTARQRRQGEAEKREKKAAELLEEQRKNAGRKPQREKRMQEDRERKERGTAERAARQQRERKARYEARQQARGDTPPLPLRQRPLPPLTYDEGDLTIKEEVIEPWEI